MMTQEVSRIVKESVKESKEELVATFRKIVEENNLTPKRTKTEGSHESQDEHSEEGGGVIEITTLAPSKPGIPGDTRSMSFEDPRLIFKMGPAEDISFSPELFHDSMQTYCSVLAHYLTSSKKKQIAYHHPFVVYVRQVVDPKKNKEEYNAAVAQAAEELNTTYKGNSNYSELPELRDIKTFSFTVHLDGEYFTHIYYQGRLYQCSNEKNKEAMRWAKSIVAKLEFSDTFMGFDLVHNVKFNQGADSDDESDDEESGSKSGKEETEKSFFDTSEYSSLANNPTVKALVSIGNVLEFITKGRQDCPDPKLFLHEKLSALIAKYITASGDGVYLGQHYLYSYFGYQMYQNFAHESSGAKAMIDFMLQYESNPHFESKFMIMNGTMYYIRIYSSVVFKFQISSPITA